jgi:hypothetical protein
MVASRQRRTGTCRTSNPGTPEKSKGCGQHGHRTRSLPARARAAVPRRGAHRAAWLRAVAPPAGGNSWRHRARRGLTHSLNPRRATAGVVSLVRASRTIVTYQAYAARPSPAGLARTLGRTLPAQIAVLAALRSLPRGLRRLQSRSASVAVSVGRAVRGVGAGRPEQALLSKVCVSKPTRRLELSGQPGCAERGVQGSQLVEPRRIGRGKPVGTVGRAAQFRQRAGKPVAGGTAGANSQRPRVRPNTSFKRIRNGMALGPCNALVYRAPHGPSAMPLRPA